MSTKIQTILLIDGSHYDRLKSVFETPFDLRRLADFVTGGTPPDHAIYYRDVRDANEDERQRSLFGWLRHNGFTVKGRTHDRNEPRERYGTNLVEIAVDGLLLAEPGDHVVLVGGDAKLAPLLSALKEYDIRTTLVSTLGATATIAPSSLLLDLADTFIDIADILPTIALEKPRPRDADA
ncbi:NYN domain-containing protein [Pararhizobium sp. PWRC1-1]|uniref:NYN domain-containing protein n=1 Tax=Pararhizobium sp. PWRC1-1 TaxID=2804566 RepID=UPI003CF8002F